MADNKTNYLLENYLKTLVYTTIHEVTNSYSLIAGFTEDILEEIEEKGKVVIEDRSQIALLVKGLQKLRASMDNLKENNYFQSKKENIRVHDLCDEVMESCRHAFVRGEPKFTTECMTEKILVDKAKLFVLSQLAIIHFATKENHIKISLNGNNLKFESELLFPLEQINMLYKSLDWKDSFRVMVTGHLVSIDIL